MWSITINIICELTLPVDRPVSSILLTKMPLLRDLPQMISKPSKWEMETLRVAPAFSWVIGLDDAENVQS